jgi:S-methylmethionine-dependent homocysteine/selenocysteine methylase
VTSLDALLARLEAGRPLILGSDPASAFVARGVELEGAAPLGRAVRESPTAVSEHYREELTAGADVLVALTDETMPRALAMIGMAFRSAALTGTAVDLALEAAEASRRGVVVAGLLGARWIAPALPERITEEYGMHATRLSTSGCELIVARGFSPEAFRHGTQLARLARMSAISSGCATKLPTWALFESADGERVADGDPLEDAARSATNAGVHSVLVEVPSEVAGKVAIDTMVRAGVSRAGVLLAASPESQHGVPDTTTPLEVWVAACKRLVDGGARLVGGGAGTTSKHVAMLSRALKGSDRSGSDRPPLWPQAV